MSAEEWEKIKELFEKASDLTDGDREAYLEKQCAGQPEMLKAVRELLVFQSDESSDSFPASAYAGRVFQDGDIVNQRFRIIRLIARGGMGEVYEAHDQTLRRRYALKTVRPEEMSDLDTRARFTREVLMAREVSHENLCRVHELVEHRSVGQQRPILCLTMDLLDGEDLAAYLRRHRPLPTEQALSILSQVAAGLAELHRKGIVHRDLKPSNIMLVPQPDGTLRAVVTDFGLAKTIHTKEEVFESCITQRAGAPYFMAPELWDGGRPSVSSDVYALGMILDEMVTRSRAFPTGSIGGLYYAKLREGPVKPSLRATALPARWERVILRCLDLYPERRFSRVRHVIAELKGEPEVDQSRWEALLPESRTRRAAIAALCSAPLLGGAAIVGYQRTRRPPEVVVLPIQNLTGRKELDYFSFGTTAELLRRLNSQVDLRIIPYYEKNYPKPDPNRKYLLEGALQEQNGKVFLQVRLLNGSASSVYWSDRTEQDVLKEPVRVQSRVADGALAALRAQVNPQSAFVPSVMSRLPSFFPQSARRPNPDPTRSSEALNLYMRGRHLLEDFNVPSALAAVQYFESALAADPGFALAWTAIAEAQLILTEFNHAPYNQLIGHAEECARKAIDFDPQCPEAHAALGAVTQAKWDWSAAEKSYQQALSLSPNFARAHRWFAGLVMQFGRFDMGLAETRTALALDPYDYSAYPGYGLYFFCARQYDEAMLLLHKAIDGRNSLGARHNLASVHVKLGQLSSGATAAAHFQQALEQADKVAEWESRTYSTRRPAAISDRIYALAYAASGRTSEARVYIERLAADMQNGYTSPTTLAWIYCAMGEYDSALLLLEKALTQQDRKLLYLKVHPLMEPMAELPRFRAIVAAMRV